MGRERGKGVKGGRERRKGVKGGRRRGRGVKGGGEGERELKGEEKGKGVGGFEDHMNFRGNEGCVSRRQQIVRQNYRKLTANYQ